MEHDATHGRSPHVAYFINLFPNLIETMIYREVRALRDIGYEIDVFSIRRPERHLIPPEAGDLAVETFYILPISPWRLCAAHFVTLMRYPARYWRILFEIVTGTHARLRDRLRSFCHFAEAVAVLPAVERLNVDHLHAHWSLGSTTIAMVVSRFLGTSFSFTAHAYDIWREQLLLPEKLRAAQLAVTCTDCNRRHLIEAYGGDPLKVRVVYHGLNVEQFQPRPHVAGAEPLILSVGRLVEQKGFDRLLRACSDLAAEGVRFQCQIVGDGPLRTRLAHLAADLRLDGRVRFLGRMFHDELIEYYARADLFALLCVPASDDDRDGIPNTLIEAMAMELPVISTRFSGIPELVIERETGLLVDADDHDAAVAALRTLLADPQGRERMGQAGRRRVRETFTIQTSVAKLDATFTSLLSARTARAS